MKKNQRTTAHDARRSAAASRRKFYVFVSLMAVMTLTSALLLAIQPAPLSPDASRSLLAIDSPDSQHALFDTRVPVRGGQWKNIFIHHSRTASGSADTLADEAGSLPDHFVIGNGDGCSDGEIQVGQRWNQQQSPGKTAGVQRVDPGCISVCLIGDFDHAFPTPLQMQRLAQLVQALQGKLEIGPDHIWLVDAPGSPAGTGRYFPRTAFREQVRR